MQIFVIYSYFTEEEQSRDHYRELTEEQNLGFDEDHLKIVDTLNVEQMAGYEKILDHVLKNKGQVFFVDGPGGTGKTYLYKALIAKVRSMDLITVATATSGIAASIMPGGRTAHSRFKIPIKRVAIPCVALQSRVALQSCLEGHL